LHAASAAARPGRFVSPADGSRKRSAAAARGRPDEQRGGRAPGRGRVHDRDPPREPDAEARPAQHGGDRVVRGPQKLSDVRKSKRAKSKRAKSKCSLLLALCSLLFRCASAPLGAAAGTAPATPGSAATRPPAPANPR